MSVIEAGLSITQRAARGLRRSPGFTAAVVASLALGVGANTAVFSMVREALLRPLPFPDSNELVSVGTSTSDGMSWDVADYDLAAWQGFSRTLDGLSWVRVGFYDFVSDARTERVKGVRTAPNLLKVLGARVALGRWFSIDEATRDDPVVVLSHAMWQRHFGSDPGIIGRASARVDGRPFTVIGVMPPGMGYPMDADFWYLHRDNIAVEAVGRTRAGATLDAVRRELRELSPGIELNRKMGISVDFQVSTLHDRLYGANGPILRLLLGTVVLLLILACTNVTSLSLARNALRRRELAVCLALGATRRLLALQVLAENLMLAMMGGVAAVVIAVWTTGLLVQLSPEVLSGVRSAGIGLPDILFAAGVASIAGLVVSLAPTLALARADLRPAIGNTGALGHGAGATARMRTALVVAQLAIALLLLSASGLLIRSMVRLTRIETGFNPRGLVITQLHLFGPQYQSGSARRVLIDELVARIGAVPGVRSVAVGPPPLVGGSGRAFMDGWSNIYSLRDSSMPGAPLYSVWVKYVDASYLETFGIHVRAGRGILTTDDLSAPAVALVNKSAERLLFPEGAVLGRRLERGPQRASGGQPITVVGLLPDVRQRDVTIPAYPEIWLPLAQQDNRDPNVFVSARTDAEPQALERTVRRIVTELDPDLTPRRVSTMQGIIHETLASQRYVLIALVVFSALAVVMAILGLYSVMAYLTDARTREIGVRMAVGAGPRQVLFMVLRDGIRLAALGASIGLPVAYLSSHVMARFLYEVEPHDAWAFFAAAAVLALAALAAAYLPARHATRVDPTRALRAD